MVIDDEADQASLDASGGLGERTKINKEIHRILSLQRVSYLGYTATPFANILIDPRFQDDVKSASLFPRDFLYVLPEPGKSYFGTKAVFGYTSPNSIAESEIDLKAADILREIAVGEERLFSKKSAKLADYRFDTESSAIADAIKYFFLTVSARRIRGQGWQNTSMLVHTSQFVSKHGGVASIVSDYLESLYGNFDNDKDVAIEQFRAHWESEAGRFNPEEIAVESFEDLLPELTQILARRKIVLVIENASSNARLRFPEVDHLKRTVDGAYQIIIGGNTLSRGLTIQGLTCTYFSRASQTYDALLQMARWFGYRDGYADLARIWMPIQTAAMFNDLAQVEEELRAQIRLLQNERNIGPLDVVLKIRSHPSLQVTSQKRIWQAVEVRSDFSMSAHQTTHFRSQALDELQNNWTNAANLMKFAQANAAKKMVERGANLFAGVDQAAICEFLSGYSFHENWLSDVQSLLNYIQVETNADNGSFTWNVLLLSGVDSGFDAELGGIPIRTLNRSQFAKRGLDADGELTIIDLGGIKNSKDDETLDLRMLGKLDAHSSNLGVNPRDTSRAALLALYPISRSYDYAGTNSGRSRRESLHEPDHLLGIMIVLPPAVGTHEGIYWRLPWEMIDEARKDHELELVEIEKGA